SAYTNPIFHSPPTQTRNNTSRPLPYRGERVMWGILGTGLASPTPADRVTLCRWGSPFPAAGLRYAMSDRKSQFIAICMFVGAVAMIGLALTGTPQMRGGHSPVVAVVAR